MLIPFDEYKKDYEAFKKSEFIIPDNEIKLIVDSITIDVGKPLPQFINDYFEEKDLPYIYMLLRKYTFIDNIPQIRDTIAKFGYNATGIHFNYDSTHAPDAIRFCCNIGRPRKS
jgi:hypothetical protein